MSIRLYIGNLPKELEKQELQAVFSEFDESVTTKIITDRKTGKCRGFGFVTVKSDEQADQLLEKFNGYMFKDQPLKLEKALPRAKGSEEEQQQQAPTLSSAPSGLPSPTNRKKGGGGSNKSKKSTTITDSDAVQPDPRWAQELEKLKQLLATQTANS